MSLTTWYNKDLRDQFRMNIRYHSDVFREKLYHCIQDSHEVIPPLINGNFLSTDNIQIDQQQWAYSTTKACLDMKKTLVWQKQQAMQQVLPWLNFLDSHLYEKHAYRLLILEMWCRIVLPDTNPDIPGFSYKSNFMTDEELANLLRLKGLHDYIPSKEMEITCKRRADYTARIEYF